jgi:hypothetical protein
MGKNGLEKWQGIQLYPKEGGRPSAGNLVRMRAYLTEYLTRQNTGRWKNGQFCKKERPETQETGQCRR